MSAVAGIINQNKDDQTEVKSLVRQLQHRLQSTHIYSTHNLILISEKNDYHLQNDHYFVAWDGSLFNYKDLIKKYALKARTPSETILELYQLKGTEAWEQLEGMFVIALWDKIKKEFYLIRDQLGEKPVYYWYQKQKLVFASEIKAVLAHIDVHRVVNLAALEKYLTFSYVPGAETMIKNIYELLPAHFLLFKNNQLYDREFWQLTPALDILEQKNHQKAEPVLAAEMRSHLNDAIIKRLPATNENLGCFLSGGIDSSLVAALGQKYYSQNLKTYSVHFGKKYHNELYYSSLVAKHIKSDHQILEIKPKNFLHELYHIIWYLDDPIGDPITVPNFIMAREARRDVRIILNGEGGDPCFGGPKNIPIMLSQLYNTQAANNDYLAQYYLRSYKKCYEILPFLFSENTKINLKRHNQPMTEFVNSHLSDNNLISLLDKLMFLNIRLKGAHHILAKVDKMSAANHLEARSPLFSPQISRFSFEVPGFLKLNSREEKYILKKAVEDLLPSEIVYREKKGMMVPVKYWFQKEMRRFAQKVLNPKKIKEKGYFNPEYVSKLLKYRPEVQYSNNIGLQIWMLLTFEIWHQLFIEQGTY